MRRRDVADWHLASVAATHHNVGKLGFNGHGAETQSASSRTARHGGGLLRTITQWARLQLQLRLDDGLKQPEAYLAVIAHE
jgi:hypothetical protein